MKSRWTLLLIFLSGFAIAFAGCSSDSEEEPVDGELVEMNGLTFLVKEKVVYPDSTIFWMISVPCQPIRQKQIPIWLYDWLLQYGAQRGSAWAFQGEWKDTREPTYGLVYGLASSPFYPMCYADGSLYSITSFYPKAKEQMSDSIYYDFLYNKTTNWRCIYAVDAELYNK